MIYINILIIILLLLLALLSYKNKSKYKALGHRYIVCIVLAMADYLYEIYLKKWDSIGKHFKMIYTVPSGKELQLAKSFTVKRVAACIGVVYVINILAIGFLVLQGRSSHNENIIVRQEYNGDVETYDLKLEDAEKNEIYTLKVFPVEYTKAEFEEKADLVFEGLCDEVLGTNTDIKHINTDLILPDTDATGVFNISWASNRPEILSTNGRLNNLNLSKGVEVELYATVECQEHTKEYCMVLYIEPYKKQEPSVVEQVAEKLVELEKNNRTSKELKLPDEISGVNVSVVKERDNIQYKLLLLGLCICIVYMSVEYGKVKDKSKNIERELVDGYAGFIDSFSLLIESGMTIKGALLYLSISDDVGEKMSKELKYAINMIDTGYEEAYVYGLLGERLGIKIYSRLFSEIIQSVKKGNAQIRAILNNYGYEAEQISKENIKKKGEQASTKLLIPMFMILIIILLILILPAVMNF